MLGRHFSLIMFLLVGLVSCALSPQAETVAGDKYIGVEFPRSTHESLQDLGGWLFYSERGFPLGSALVKEKETDMHLLLFGVKIKGSPTTSNFYRTVQVIRLPELSGDQHLMTGILFQCGIAGEYDEGLILLGTDALPEKPYNTEFSRGWKINNETQRLDEISVDGVDYRCENVAHTL